MDSQMGTVTCLGGDSSSGGGGASSMCYVLNEQ